MKYLTRFPFLTCIGVALNSSFDVGSQCRGSIGWGSGWPLETRRGWRHRQGQGVDCHLRQPVNMQVRVHGTHKSSPWEWSADGRLTILKTRRSNPVPLKRKRLDNLAIHPPAKSKWQVWRDECMWRGRAILEAHQRRSLKWAQYHPIAVIQTHLTSTKHQ